MFGPLLSQDIYYSCLFNELKYFSYLFILYPFIISLLITAFLFWKKAPLNNYAVVLVNFLLLFPPIIFALSFANIAPECGIMLSNHYWRGEARPIAILEHSTSTNSTLDIILQNVGEPIVVRRIRVDDTGKDLDLVLQPGETKQIALKINVPDGACLGCAYKFDVSITYITPDGQEKVFVGIRPIVGKYA